MSRRGNQRRRAARRIRDRALPDSAPNLTSEHVFSKWEQILRNMRARGFHESPFTNLAFLPFRVTWNPNDADPPRQAIERTEAEIIRRTLLQRPS